MRPSRPSCRPLATSLVLLTLASPPLAAQSVTAEVSASMQPSLSSAALWGGALTLGDALAVRLGGAVAERPAGGAGGGTSIGAYALDLDLILAPGSSSAARAYAFGGVGVLGRSTPGLARESGSSMGAGIGFMVPLLEVFTLDASSRYRFPLGDTLGFAGPFPRGFEYRAGIGLRFGGTAPRTVGRGSGARWPSGGGTVGGSRRAAAVLPTAERYLGVRYVWGGEDPRSGFDCSGFTQYVFREHGVALPRTSRAQVHAGQGITPSVQALRPGDLVMFAEDMRRIDHVAIYAGDGRIIHSTSSGGGVRYDDLYSQRGEYFRRHMVAARRVMDDGGSLVRALERTFNLTPMSFDPPDRAPRP